METSGIRSGGGPILAVLVAASMTGAAFGQVDRHWLTPADGLWTDGARWTGGIEPQTIDSAFIDASGGPFIVTLDQNRTIANFTMSPPSANATLRLASGAVLTLTGSYSQVNNTLQGTPGAAVSVAGTTTFQGVQLVDVPAFNASGPLVLQGAAGHLISNTSLNLTGASGLWQDAGDITFAGGAGASGLSIGAATVFTIANDRTASWNNTGTRPDLINTGTLDKNGGAATTSILGIRLNNTGTVRASSGILRFDTVANIAGGVLTGGTWRVENNSSLDLLGQNITTNRAVVELNGTNAAFAAFNSLQTNDTTGIVRLTGGRSFTAQGSLTNNGVFQLGGGASMRVLSGNTFNLTGGSISGGGQTSVLLTEGDAVLQGGTLSAITYMSMGNLRITGGTPLLCDDTCFDHGGLGMNWEGTGPINVGGGTNFVFGAASMVNLTNQQTMAWNNTGAQPTIDILGTLVRNSLGTTSTISGVVLTNSGTIRVQSGTLVTDTVQNLAAGTLTGGNWEVMDNATLDFAGPTITTNQANITLDGANATFNAVNSLTTNGANGHFTVKNGKTFTTTGNFTNNGAVQVVGDTGPATFKVAPGSTLTNYNPVTRRLSGGSFVISGPGRDSGSVEVDGLDVATLDAGVTLDGAGASLLNPTDPVSQDALHNLALVDNAGAFTVTHGKNFDSLADFSVAPTGQLEAGMDSTFTVNGDLGNFDAAGRFSDGQFTVGGTLRANNANLVTLANTLNLDSIGRIERPDGAGGFINALPSLETIDTTGHLTIRNGHQLTLDPHAFETLAGSALTIGPPGAAFGDTFLHVQGGVTHAGTLTLDNGLMRVDDDFTNNGTIRGDGAIDLPGGRTLINNGRIEPGQSPGILAITGGGGVLMRDTGVISIEIAGLMPGTQYDQLNIDGRLLFDTGLAGRIEVILDPAYTPVAGDTFEILHYASFDGWFAQLDISDIFRQIRESDRFILQVIPTPGAGLVLALGGLLASRRRR